MNEQERAAALAAADRIEAEGLHGVIAVAAQIVEIMPAALRAFANRPSAPADLREVVAKAVSDEYALSGLIANYPKSDRVADAILSAIASHGYEVVPAGERQAQAAEQWLPVSAAPEPSVQRSTDPTVKTTETLWVRDRSDGLKYEAWFVDAGGKRYWWDVEGEDTCDPVEWCPHPLEMAVRSELARVRTEIAAAAKGGAA